MSSYSPYYPPRARWYSGLHQIWHSCKRLVQLDALPRIEGFTLWQFLLSLVLPGYAFTLFRHKRLGHCISWACAFAAVAFFIFLGYPVADWCFMAIASAHAISLIHLTAQWQDRTRTFVRAITAVTIVAVLLLFVYNPLRQEIEDHWFLPLRVPKGVVIIARTAPKSVHCGELIAYRIDGKHFQGVYLAAGYGIERVMAVAGDEVVFTPEAMQINGKNYPRQRYMPNERVLIVPRKRWFIWPNYTMNVGRNVPIQNVTDGLMSVALIDEQQYLGRPLQHWFGRRQPLP